MDKSDDDSISIPNFSGSILGEPDRGADFTGQPHRFTPLRQRQIGLGIGGRHQWKHFEISSDTQRRQKYSKESYQVC